MKKALWIVLSVLLGMAAGFAGEHSNAESVLEKTSSFALGGVGVVGSMSQGERSLREILKEADASARLQKMLPNASPAGQLYALLGLRMRDRAAYQRALPKYGVSDAKVETARGCMLGQESFRDLVKEIEHGDYDSILARDWSAPAR